MYVYTFVKAVIQSMAKPFFFCNVVLAREQKELICVDTQPWRAGPVWCLEATWCLELGSVWKPHCCGAGVCLLAHSVRSAVRAERPACGKTQPFPLQWTRGRREVGGVTRVSGHLFQEPGPGGGVLSSAQRTGEGGHARLRWA